MPKNGPDKDLFFKVQIMAIFKIRIKYTEVHFTFKVTTKALGNFCLSFIHIYYTLF